MKAVPLTHGSFQTNPWMIHCCRCSLLWLLAVLLQESDAFFLAAPGRGQHRSRSPLNSTEKKGHVATAQQQQQKCLLSSRGRRRSFGQKKLRDTEESSPEPANTAVPGDVETHAKRAFLPCDSATVAPHQMTLPPTRAPRMYLRGSNLRVGQMIQLPPDQTRYLVSVMRLREGNPVRVFDGVNGEFLATVCGIQDKSSSGRGNRARRSGGGGSGIDRVELRIECLTRPQPTGDDGGGQGAHVPDVELIFAPIRKQRLKMLVEKAVEIGASRLTPVLTARTQKGAVADASALGKLGLVTAVEAAEQCERMIVPHVGATPVTLASLFRELEARHTGAGACVAGIQAEQGGADGGGRVIDEDGKRVGLATVFVCKERDMSAPPLLEALAEYARATGRDTRHGTGGSYYNASAAFLIGPEGGFDPDEIRVMAAFPFVRFVSLGPTVLRAETAAVYALSTWSAFWAASRAQNPA